MRASGCAVPDWMVALPNPSQNSKKQLKQRPIGRKDISRTLGAGALDDAEEGARTKAPREKGDKGQQNKRKGGPGKKERIMSGVGSGFAGAGGKARQQQQQQQKQSGAGKKDDKVAAERPAKKAKREVALEE